MNLGVTLLKFGLFYQAQLPKPLDSDDWYPGQEAKLFHETLEQIEFADKLGFDYVFLAEHHFTGEYNHMSATDVMLGAIAARTKQIRLGPGIVQMMPGNNHPVKVAENMGTIDILSNGRLEFGVGVGGVAEQDALWPELRAVVQAGKPYDVLWECVRETLRLMTLNPYTGFKGEYLNLPVCNVVPKPVQKPHPPIWLAVTSERSLKLSAERGMGALCLAQGGPEVVQQRVADYWRMLSDNLNPIGDAINPIVCTFTAALVADTDEKARAAERGGAAFTNYAIRRAHELTNTTGHIHREWVQGGDTEKVETIDSPEHRAHIERLAVRGVLESSPDAPGTIIGSPELARRKILNFEETGVDVLSFSQQVGTRTHEAIMESLEHLGKLLPEFKERHEKGGQARIDRVEKLGFASNASI